MHYFYLFIIIFKDLTITTQMFQYE